jgi:hypothetical protein
MQEDERIAVDKELSIRPNRDELLLDWETTCDFHGTEVRRSICQGIEKELALRWLRVFTDGGTCANKFDGLHMLKTPTQNTLTFTRTFLMPNSLDISLAAQDILKRLLEQLVLVRE